MEHPPHIFGSSLTMPTALQVGYRGWCRWDASTFDAFVPWLIGGIPCRLFLPLVDPTMAGVPRLTTNSLSSRCLVQGSGRTVETGRGHRPWFGRQQAKKRRQGMPLINKRTNASKVLASQPHHLLQSVGGAVGIVYELPKKGGGCSLSTPAFDASPLHRRSTQMMT